jgi:hypothetical protein
MRIALGRTVEKVRKPLDKLGEARFVLGIGEIVRELTTHGTLDQGPMSLIRRYYNHQRYFENDSR